MTTHLLSVPIPPELPNCAALRRCIWLRRRRMEWKAVSELPSPAISFRVLRVPASTGHPQLCRLLRGGHMERHSRFRELLRHRGKHPPLLAHLGRSSSLWCSAVGCFVQSWVSSCGDRRGHHRTEPSPVQPCHGCTSAHLCGPMVSWHPMARSLSAIGSDIGLPSSWRPFYASGARSSVVRGTCPFSSPTARSKHRCREYPLWKSSDTRHPWLEIARPGRGNAANRSYAPGYTHSFSGVNHPNLDSDA
jgi:hypothetical protein